MKNILYGSRDILLVGMIVSYIIAIYYCWLAMCDGTFSVSNMICHKEYNNCILIAMCCMGLFTILYEIARSDNYLSLLCMVFLLIGIYGVINIDESNDIHYVFAALVFFSIISFMINHCYITKSNALFILLYIQIILFLFTVFNFSSYELFIYGEILYILNFAVFYFYLHYESSKNKKKNKNKNKTKNKKKKI